MNVAALSIQRLMSHRPMGDSGEHFSLSWGEHVMAVGHKVQWKQNPLSWSYGDVTGPPCSHSNPREDFPH